MLPLYLLLWAGIPQKKWSSHHGQQKSPKCSTWMQSQKRQNDLCLLPRQTIQCHSTPSLCLDQECWRSWSLMVLWRPIRLSRTNTPKDVLFIIGDWNAKVGGQEIPGVTGKFGLGVQNEACRRLTEFCQENVLVIANTLFQQHKRRLYTWTSPDGRHWNQIDLFFAAKDGEALYSQQKQDWELTVAQAGKTTRPFRYDLNQMPYDYTVEVTNRFKGLDLIDKSAWLTVDRGSWHCIGGSDQHHPQEKEMPKGKISPYK